MTVTVNDSSVAQRTKRNEQIEQTDRTERNAQTDRTERNAQTDRNERNKQAERYAHHNEQREHNNQQSEHDEQNEGTAATGAAAHTAARSRNRETDAVAMSLLTLLADLPDGSADRPRIRARIIELYVPLAEYLARRFRNRGEPLDDLVQVACIGLVKAVDGFDMTRGAAFTTYAIPMITGELKRHFRDRTWDVRVPRRVQENRWAIGKVTEELTHALGRSPTVADLAARLELSEEDILEGLEANHAYRAVSLQTPLHTDDGETELGEMIGSADNDLEQTENRVALEPLLAALPAREQKLLTMRFFGNLTQSQIAEAMGISQMHVSRLIAQALTTLRRGLLTG
jgi:RNA polymerase sigma-B factor